MTAYGAIPTNKPDEESSFVEYNVDYVPQRKLTTKERISKIVTAGVPILIAMLFMLGFGLWTSRALAPRHITGLDHTAVPAQYLTIPPFPESSPGKSKQVVKSESGDESIPSKPISSTSTKGGKGCSDNLECKALGLIGDCCPTAEGIQLGCCS